MRADARTAVGPMAADTHPVIAGAIAAGMATAAATVTVEAFAMVAGDWAVLVTGLATILVIPITDTLIRIIQHRPHTIIPIRMRMRIRMLTYILVLP